jgi:hypothetical protein
MHINRQYYGDNYYLFFCILGFYIFFCTSLPSETSPRCSDIRDASPPGESWDSVMKLELPVNDTIL